MSKKTNNNSSGKPTIKLVAEKSGVSIGTVSRVINNKPGVKPYTRDKVLQIMKEVNYQPDLAARELVSGGVATIGLNIGPGVNRLTPFYFLFLESLSQTASINGFRFQEILNNPNGLPTSLPDAMVLLGAHDDDPRINYLKEKKISFVLIGHGKNISWIMPNDFDGGYQAATHLIRLGHKKIVHISGFMMYQTYHDRYAGFKKALEEAEINHHHDYLIDGEFTSLGAYRAIRKFMEQKKEFSAVFAASDEMAIGAIAALEDAHLKVPGDISVVGFDDLPEIASNLTTVRQDISLMAATAIKLLLDEMSGIPSKHVVLPVQLVARTTTARNFKKV